MSNTNSFQENLSWVKRHYRPHKGKVVRILCQSVLTAILGTLIPILYMHIIDGLSSNLSTSSLLQSVFLVVGIGILNFLIGANTASLRAILNVSLEWSFRQSAFEHIIRLNQRFYRSFRTGDLVTRLTDDVGRKLAWFVCSGVFRAIDSVLKILFVLGAMVYLNPILALVALIPLPFQALIFVKSSKILHQRFSTLQQLISKVNAAIETCFSGIKVVQAYRMENHQAEKFRLAAVRRAVAEVQTEKAHAFVHNLYGYFWQFAEVLVLITGGYFVIDNRISVGEFVAFNAFVGRLIWPMFDIGGVMVLYRRGSVSMDRIREIESFKPELLSPENPLPFPKGSGRISFESVTFSLDKQNILKDISFDFGGARMIAIVGSVGSGKSTLLNLAARFFDPDVGVVLLDGSPINQLSYSLLRSSMGYVSQEPLLFTDTIEGNIRFGRLDITDQDIHWAARAARLEEDLSTFPLGFDTPVGLRGHTLSGGQKQRLAVARALAGKPSILILDDPSSNLDADTEASLWRELDRVLPESRLLLTTHRTATLERADLILVLKNGRLVEQGRHGDLIQLKGEYFQIYSRQRLEEQILPGVILQ